MSGFLKTFLLSLLFVELGFSQPHILDLSIPQSSGHFFVFHRFNDPKHASTSISSDHLIKHFETLKQKNYYFASLDEIMMKLQNNEAIPNHWVHFTIDDSYKSFYQNGLPLFKKYKIPFTLYIYVEATEKHYRDFMSWDEIKESMKYGDIGVHSFGHKHMTKLSPKEIKEDTQKALNLIKKHLGVTPKSYAYPYGEYDETVFSIIKSFGFKLIMNQNQGAFSHKSDEHDLDRIALTGDVALKHKLSIKHLPAKWQSVDVDRKNRILKSISLEVDPSIKSVQCYISGGTWQKLKPKKGKITKIFNQKLKFNRSRVIIKSPNNAWTSQIIIL